MPESSSKARMAATSAVASDVPARPVWRAASTRHSAARPSISQNPAPSETRAVGWEAERVVA